MATITANNTVATMTTHKPEQLLSESQQQQQKQ